MKPFRVMRFYLFKLLGLRKDWENLCVSEFQRKIIAPSYYAAVLPNIVENSSNFRKTPAILDVHHGGRVKVEENKKIIFVGRFAQEKGFVDFVRLAKSFPDKTFRAVGSGYCLDHASLPDNLEVVSWCDEEALVWELASARLVVFPSSWFECDPLVILEAHFLGVPVLISRIVGVSQYYESRLIPQLPFIFDSFDDLIQLVDYYSSDQRLSELSIATKSLSTLVQSERAEIRADFLVNYD